MKDVESDPVDEVVGLATWVLLKSTTTVSLAPNPVPVTATLVVGGPTFGDSVMAALVAQAGPAAPASKTAQHAAANPIPRKRRFTARPS